MLFLSSSLQTSRSRAVSEDEGIAQALLHAEYEKRPVAVLQLLERLKVQSLVQFRLQAHQRNIDESQAEVSGSWM